MTEISKALNEYARNAGLALPGPVGEEDWLKRVVEMVLQALIEGEATSVIGASRYERTDERVNHRNGRCEIEPFRSRVGELALSVPRLRKGSYYPSFLDARKPVERALLTTIQTAYVAGVSTRRVDELVQALGLTGIDKSAVSRTCNELDDAVKPFREHALEIEYPYVLSEGAPEQSHAQPSAGHCDRSWSERTAENPGI